MTNTLSTKPINVVRRDIVGLEREEQGGNGSWKKLLKAPWVGLEALKHCTGPEAKRSVAPNPKGEPKTFVSIVRSQ